MYNKTDYVKGKGNKMKEKIHFYVPDFYSNAPLYVLLADFIEHIPQWFYDDFDIAAAYGSFPNCIWNGGRTSFGSVEADSMEKIVEELNKRNIAVRHTFTNPLIEEKHLSDIFANICLQVADNGKNEVLVNTQVMEDYVRANYPSYKVISSTTKCLKTIKEVEDELKKDYYLVVLDSALNVDPAIFNIEGKERLELLVDHACRVDCPNRTAHYKDVGKSQLSYRNSKFKCPYIGATFEDIMKREHSITREMMNEKFIPGGIRHFKLDGRAFAAEKLVDSILYFMVKPEYRSKVKEIIKKEVYKNQNVW